jgi:FkbM family methyltransferase
MKREDDTRKKEGSVQDKSAKAGGRPLVYDVGLHNGDDAAYYLKKGFDVIGIDAHAGLCRSCSERFCAEIADGRMHVLNVGVGDREGTMEFFQNEAEDAISTFHPGYWEGRDWTPAQVKVRKLSSIVREYGEPYFMKIDVEFVDHIVLLDLFMEGIIPKHVSAEAQLIDVYCALVSMGYESFKIVRGKDIPSEFGRCEVRSFDGNVFQHEFSPKSSGPFADDLPGNWMTKTETLDRLLEIGLGWVDLHATR